MDAILKNLLAKQNFADQSELLAAMASAGFVMTQSTLSRKLKTLGYQKSDGRYVALRNSNTSLISAQIVPPNLLVLRTAPGFANAVAVHLDREPLPGQAGTIAGDDTVFVAVQTESMASANRIAQSWVALGK
jgi:transcriptional regulator of arginine metabolism